MQGRSTDDDMGGGRGEHISRRGGQGRAPQMRRVIRHAPHEIYKNLMKTIAVLFYLTALGQLHTR